MKTLRGTALLAVTLCGCGGDAVVLPPPPPHPGGAHISIAVSSNANVRKGNSAQVTVTVLRFSLLTGPIDLSIAGLVPGVTATFDPASVPEGSTTSTLSFAAAADAPTGAIFVTVAGQLGGLNSATQLLVTVSP